MKRYVIILLYACIAVNAMEDASKEDLIQSVEQLKTSINSHRLKLNALEYLCKQNKLDDIEKESLLFDMQTILFYKEMHTMHNIFSTLKILQSNLPDDTEDMLVIKDQNKSENTIDDTW